MFFITKFPSRQAIGYDTLSVQIKTFFLTAKLQCRVYFFEIIALHRPPQGNAVGIIS
jgi:hypothetical protein